MPATRELTLCNAGHPHPIIFQAVAKTWRYLDENAENAGIENYPLGIDSAAAYDQFKMQLKKGDLLLCYTDSLIEAECRDGTQLGSERLLELLNAIPMQTPDAATHVIHHLLAKFAVYGATLNDDVTILLTRCSGPSKGQASSNASGAEPKLAKSSPSKRVHPLASNGPGRTSAELSCPEHPR